MEQRNRVRLEILGIPENVGLARVCMASFAAQLDFTVGELEELKVAVSEAVTNSIIHGYGEERGIVSLVATRDDERVEIVVEDRGRGIEDVEAAMQPSFSTDPERMGLGFVFMESFMDDVEVTSRPGEGTTVRMWKSRSSSAEGDSG